MNFHKSIAALFLSSTLVVPAFADGDDDHHIQTKPCTAAAINAAAAVGADATNTTCIQKRDHVKVVVVMNSSQRHGRTFRNTGATVAQQAINVRNLGRDYVRNYGMEAGEEFDIVVVAYAAGLDWLRKDREPANQNLITGLMKDDAANNGFKVKFYACQNTMKGKGLTLADLVDGVETVPAGVTAVIDMQKQGRTYIVP